MVHTMPGQLGRSSAGASVNLFLKRREYEIRLLMNRERKQLHFSVRHEKATKKEEFTPSSLWSQRFRFFVSSWHHQCRHCWWDQNCPATSFRRPHPSVFARKSRKISNGTKKNNGVRENREEQQRWQGKDVCGKDPSTFCS